MPVISYTLLRRLESKNKREKPLFTPCRVQRSKGHSYTCVNLVVQIRVEPRQRDSKDTVHFAECSCYLVAYSAEIICVQSIPTTQVIRGQN